MIKVLIVEDEKLIAMDLKLTLNKMGIKEIDITDNGKDAVSLSAQKEFDLIIMDINILGNIDGVDTAIRIQKNKKIPVLFCTAYSDKLTMERTTNVYSIGFLEKPFVEDDLEGFIKKIILIKKVPPLKNIKIV